MRHETIRTAIYPDILKEAARLLRFGEVTQRSVMCDNKDAALARTETDAIRAAVMGLLASGGLGGHLLALMRSARDHATSGAAGRLTDLTTDAYLGALMSGRTLHTADYDGERERELVAAANLEAASRTIRGVRVMQWTMFDPLKPGYVASSAQD